MYCNELHCLPAIPKPAGLFSGSAKATLIRWTSQVPPDRKQDQFRHHQHFCLAIAVISSTSYIGTTIQVVCHYLVLWSSVGRRRIWEELGQLCRPTLSDYPEYVIRLSAGQPDRPSRCGDYLSDGSGRRRVACARPQAAPHNL